MQLKLTGLRLAPFCRADPIKQDLKRPGVYKYPKPEDLPSCLTNADLIFAI